MITAERPLGIKAEIGAACATGVQLKALRAFVVLAARGAAQHVGRGDVLAAVDTLVICKASVVSTALGTLRVPLWQVAQVARVLIQNCIEVWLLPDGQVPSRDSSPHSMHLCSEVTPANSWCRHPGLGEVTAILQLTQHPNPVPLPL